MIWHPLALAVWLLDITAWLVYLGAAWRLLKVLPHWQPASNDTGQLWRERALELTRFQGCWAGVLLAAAFVVLVIGISNLWPPLVPGAMCGTGVLQAMGPPGVQTLLYRGLTLGVFYCWFVIVQIDGRRPEGAMSLLQGRMLLMAAPLMAMSSWTLAKALSALTAQVPVSCCSIVYDQAAGLGLVAVLGGNLLSTRGWIVLCLAGTALVAAWGGALWRFALSGMVFVGVSVAMVAVWLSVTFIGLKVGIAPYVYEVLQHPCPWCFFLIEHGAVGFAFFGLMATVTAETMAGVIAVLAGRRYTDLVAQSRRRAQDAGRNVLLCAVLFLVFIAAPVLLWRMRFGGWMD